MGSGGCWCEIFEDFEGGLRKTTLFMENFAWFLVVETFYFILIMNGLWFFWIGYLHENIVNEYTKT